jgi:hypothetical protein
VTDNGFIRVCVCARARACVQTFKSANQLASHEQSKKHRTALVGIAHTDVDFAFVSVFAVCLICLSCFSVRTLSAFQQKMREEVKKKITLCMYIVKKRNLHKNEALGNVDDNQNDDDLPDENNDSADNDNERVDDAADAEVDDEQNDDENNDDDGDDGDDDDDNNNNEKDDTEDDDDGNERNNNDNNDDQADADDGDDDVRTGANVDNDDNNNRNNDDDKANDDAAADDDDDDDGLKESKTAINARKGATQVGCLLSVLCSVIHRQFIFLVWFSIVVSRWLFTIERATAGQRKARKEARKARKAMLSPTAKAGLFSGVFFFFFLSCC